MWSPNLFPLHAPEEGWGRRTDTEQASHLATAWAKCGPVHGQNALTYHRAAQAEFLRGELSVSMTPPFPASSLRIGGRKHGDLNGILEAISPLPLGLELSWSAAHPSHQREKKMLIERYLARDSHASRPLNGGAVP